MTQRIPILLGLLLASALVAGPAMADDDEGWKTYWKNGTRIESADGDFELKIGGRIQADFSFADPDPVLDNTFSLEDGSEFRRARLFVSGTLYDRYEFKAQYDFAGGDAELKDVYVGITNLPGVGGVRVGHFKEPFSLEELTSSKYLGFLERSFPVEAFSPSRNMGIMLHNQLRDDRVTWAAGVFQDSDGFGSTSSNEWNVTGRVTGLALANNENTRLLHLGLGLSKRSPIDDLARFRARPGSHLADRLVDTGRFPTEGTDLLGLELALIHGPFWLQSEYVQASNDAPAHADLAGSYLQIGYFLTGESRAYKRSAGAFDRTAPSEDFLDGGSGAWEVAFRYGEVDLTDGLAVGGEQDGFTAALNWYLNSAVRTQLNYLSTDLDGTGSVDFVTLRFQIDF